MSSNDYELYEMAKKIRQVFMDYSHIDPNYRICYALVIARTIASEVDDKKMVKAVEEVQSLISTEIFEGFIPTLKRVLKDVRKEKGKL